MSANMRILLDQLGLAAQYWAPTMPFTRDVMSSTDFGAMMCMLKSMPSPLWFRVDAQHSPPCLLQLNGIDLPPAVRVWIGSCSLLQGMTLRSWRSPSGKGHCNAS